MWWALFVAAVAVGPRLEASAAPLDDRRVHDHGQRHASTVWRGAPRCRSDVTVSADTAARRSSTSRSTTRREPRCTSTGGTASRSPPGRHARCAPRGRCRAASRVACTRVKVGVFSPGGARCTTGTTTPRTFRVSTSTTPPPSTTTTSSHDVHDGATARRRRRPARRRARPRPRRRPLRRRQAVASRRCPSAPHCRVTPPARRLYAMRRRSARPTPRSTRRRGQPSPAQPGYFGRITGNFVGTTDEIIQWAACKWGIDEDIVRAQTAKESWWFQRTGGDFTTDSTRCVPGHPIGADGRPGSARVDRRAAGALPVLGVGLPATPSTSTAFNLDAALAARRSCFEGHETWLNTVERGREYAAGDLWGCVGMWFSGAGTPQPSTRLHRRRAGLPRPAPLGAVRCSSAPPDG